MCKVTNCIVQWNSWFIGSRFPFIFRFEIMMIGVGIELRVLTLSKTPSSIWRIFKQVYNKAKSSDGLQRRKHDLDFDNYHMDKIWNLWDTVYLFSSFSLLHRLWEHTVLKLRNFSWMKLLSMMFFFQIASIILSCSNNKQVKPF